MDNRQLQKDDSPNNSELKEIAKILDEISRKEEVMRKKFITIAEKCRHRVVVPARGDDAEYHKCINPDACFNYPSIDSYNAFCKVRECPLLGDA